jgi:hypothetical protein
MMMMMREAAEVKNSRLAIEAANIYDSAYAQRVRLRVGEGVKVDQ